MSNCCFVKAFDAVSRNSLTGKPRQHHDRWQQMEKNIFRVINKKLSNWKVYQPVLCGTLLQKLSSIYVFVICKLVETYYICKQRQTGGSCEHSARLQLKAIGTAMSNCSGSFPALFSMTLFPSYLNLMQNTNFNPLIWHFLKLPLIHVVLSFNSFWLNPNNCVPPLRLSQLAARLHVPWEEGCFSLYLHIPNLCCGFQQFKCYKSVKRKGKNPI